MRIAYVLTFDPSLTSGLWARLTERLAAWSDLGVTADVVVACRHDSPLSGVSLEGHGLHLLTGPTAFIASFGLPRLLRRLNPDIVYMRYNLPYPAMVQVARSWPTVLEIHSDDLLEWRIRPARYRVLGRVLRGRLLRAVAGFVFVDPDLQDAPSYLPFRKPSVTIANGVPISSAISYGGMRARAPGPPRLVLVLDRDEPWHGLPKFCALSESAPSLEFHVVGGVSPPPQPGAVRFWGRMDKAALESFLGGMDLGVSNLALEVIGRRRPSPLKVRDYVAAGLPCVMAHDDPDLLGLPGVLNLGYGFEPGNKATELILNFAAEWTGHFCSREMADAVSITQKEAHRVAFLQCLGRGLPW